MLDTLPETVYRVTDLIMAVFNRNGKDFKEKLLTELMGEVRKSVDKLLEIAHSGVTIAPEDCEESRKAAVRIHLFTLLFEDCSRLCVNLVEDSGAIGAMVRLITATQESLAMQNSGEGSKTTPKWITPMLLFIDLYEKVVLAMNRRSAMSDICSTQWKWFEVNSGKWSDYQPANNKTINDAFWAGEQGCKFNTGRKKYNVQFGAMMQANEESGSKKPIMISLKREEKSSKRDVTDLLNTTVKRGRWIKDDSSPTSEDKEKPEGNQDDSNKKVEEAMETAPEESEVSDANGKSLNLFVNKTFRCN